MSNINKKAAAVSVEETAAASAASTKVVQMETPVSTVSQMMNKANGLLKLSKDLDILYAMREKFNSMFLTGKEDEAPQEIKSVYLTTPNASRYNDDGAFRVSHPDTILKIRALVAVDLGERIEETERAILNFKL